jgi:hypothetical protein
VDLVPGAENCATSAINKEEAEVWSEPFTQAPLIQ